MIDRLISGAGAVSARVDRFVRSVMPGTFLSDQPGSILVAAVLGVIALVLVVVGVETSGSSTLQTMDPAAIATVTDLPNRTYAAMSGRIPSTYVETYADTDMDGVQDPGETGQAWDYYLLADAGLTGVLVRSERAPDEVYRFRSDGVVVDDAEYIKEDLDLLGADLSLSGLQIDPDTYVDARSSRGGAALDLGADLPADGTSVSIDGARLVEYVPVCSGDADRNGSCSDDEVDLFDVIVYDPTSRRAVVVVTDQDPTYQAAAFTGILHRDARMVGESLASQGTELADAGITVSTVYVLDDGAGPVDGGPIYLLASIAILAAGVLVIGVVGGYVTYRRDGRLPVPATTLLPDDRLPLHVTGLLRTATGRVHVREAPADLIRFVVTPAVPTADALGASDAPMGDAPMGDAPPAEPTTTLIIERRDRPEGVAVGLGELAKLSSGIVTTFHERRPGLRLRAGTGELILSFDDAAARDRAAAELIDETGIGAPTDVAPSDGETAAPMQEGS